MIGLGMVTMPGERVGRAVKVVEPAPHRGAMLRRKRGLRRLKIEQRRRRVLDDAVNFGR